VGPCGQGTVGKRMYAGIERHHQETYRFLFVCCTRLYKVVQPCTTSKRCESSQDHLLGHFSSKAGIIFVAEVVLQPNKSTRYSVKALILVIIYLYIYNI
jgi:hypothetical protein